MRSPSSHLSPLLIMKRHGNMDMLCSNNKPRHIMPSDAEDIAEFDTSCSNKTFDADLSCRSNQSYLAVDQRRIIKGCMKVQTQRDSLNRTRTSSGITEPEQLDPVPEQKNVRFNNVEFREYYRVLSDNPSTSSGPPIGIGWTYDPKDTIELNLDAYEEDRDGSRRTKRELAIPAAVREDMLRDAGYSRNEISKAERLARTHKEQRRSSVQLMKFDPLLERVDSVKHGVKKIIPRRRSSDLVQ